MLRSMDSAVAGLRAHQNKMDVIGHNLANVNTFGFKAQTYTFKEAMYQTSSASTGGTNEAGGSNAAQYGYGTLMGTIGVDMTASTPSYVGGLNATINGEGFFMTSAQKNTDGVAINGDLKTSEVDWDYTRVGQFSVDSNGYLVDGNGNFVYGFRPGDANFKPDNDKDNPGGLDATKAKLQPLRIPVDITPPQQAGGDYTLSFLATAGADDKALKATSVSINKLGEITATITKDDKTYAGVHIGTVALVTFQNPEGLTKAGDRKSVV